MAEIHQKIVSCPVCHNFYDAVKDATCPFCGGNASFAPTQDPFAIPYPASETFSPPATVVGPQGNFSPTVDPLAGNPANYPGMNGSGNFTPTKAPAQLSGLSSRMNKTQFVDAATPTGAPSPVVGWLVAVSGPCRGTDYRIHTGYNYIGREAGDICIRGDQTISGEKDSNITYVPQTNRFYIAHEQGKNVLLVNDIPAIGGGAELHNYDRITVGSTQLLFVGFCGENFSWGDTNNK